ncbi:universal stress protein [Mycobacterium sp.]|uniref:universal stress protein n=1 Tax=Mycobacterium sp. TaxID=1785 RepID=UPI00126AB863|nr:universal stress protein [Mycobacterium sp.]KAA8969781.1 MAG: universal stress protein [Mycobacterium sp.]
MTVIAWIVETTWPACVDATRTYTPAGAEIVLVHVTDPDAAGLAHSAYAGLLGRGHPHRDPGTRVAALANAAAHELLAAAAARLERPCITRACTGQAETEVLAAAENAELLVLARDGELDRPGPESIGPTTRYLIDHALCPVLVAWPGSVQSGAAPR